jgi:hypothetical protein
MNDEELLCDRANKAEDALLRKGYRLSCDIPACNCGDQWNHGGHAEMRLSEIGEALEQAVARRNGQTILADVVHALACLDRAEAELEALRAAIDDAEHAEDCQCLIRAKGGTKYDAAWCDCWLAKIYAIDAARKETP